MFRTVHVVLLLAVAAASGAQQPVFRAETDLVSVRVTVTDRRNGFVTDLAPADFEVIEDGRPQAITHFEKGDGGERTGELHLGLLLDTSASMGADIDLARSASIKFLNTLSDATDMTLVDFDTEVRVARYGQRDFPRLVERIRSRRPSGFTAFYDALGVYLDGAAEAQGRTILVVFSDGGDTRSSIRFGDVVTLLRASDVTVYTVGFLTHQSRSVAFEQRARLERLASETGGRAFFPLSMDEVGEAYDLIERQIRAQYTLGYTSTNEAPDGTWRKVEVKVRKPGVSGVRLEARKGYFAPYRKP
jgi:Ca-activated chloride channel family protein